MNTTSKKLKDKKHGVTVESFFRLMLEVMSVFKVLEITESMSAESAIKKLYIIAKEKEVQKSEHRRKQEEEA